MEKGELTLKKKEQKYKFLIFFHFFLRRDQLFSG